MPSLKLFLAPAAFALAATIPSLGFSANTLDANTKKSERKYRATITGEGAMTQQMLETCIMLKAEIDEEYEKISASQKAFETFRDEVTQLGKAIPNKDDVPLAEYNKKVHYYNNKLNELKKLEKTYNEKVGPYRGKTAQLQKECNNQPYYPDDYASAVKKTGKEL